MGGGGGKGDPKVEYEATEVKEDEGKLKKIRTALLETEGGIGGEESQLGDVKKRDSIFGN